MQNNGRRLAILNKTNILRRASNLPQHEVTGSIGISCRRKCVHPQFPDYGASADQPPRLWAVRAVLR